MSNRRLYADNAKTTLASSVFPADTTITVTDGSLFPNPVDGDFFAVTIDAGTSAREIIHVYARSMNTFTSCVRGQEGTVAGGFGAGTRIENRATAQTYRDMARKVDRLGDIDSVDSLPTPVDTEANSYLTQSLDDQNAPIVALKNNTRWSFTTHPFLVTASSVTSDSGSNALTSLGIGAKLPDFQTGKYILSFISGPNQGLARLLTSVSADEVTWAGNALPNLYGVEFEVYQSSVSAIVDSAGQGGTGALDEVQQPVNLLPTDGTASTGITPTLVGSDFRSLYGYPHQSSQFQIALNATFTQMAADTGTIAAATSWTPATPLDQNNAYFWRVRYCDSDGYWSQFSAPTSFSTGNVVVAVPSIIAPTAGAVGVPVNPQVRGSNFSVVGGADTHESTDWEIWTGPNGTGTRVFHSENNTTDKTVIQITGLDSLTSYYVRVRYKGATYGLSSWSGSVQFSTSGFITTPSITSPTNEETDLPETFQMTSSAFSVNGSTDTHASTDWQIWTGANGTGTKVWEAMGVTGTQRTSVTVPAGVLAENSTYFARVRYRGQTLPETQWSVSVEFSTIDLFFTGAIGEFYQGGYYAGPFLDNGTWYGLVVSPIQGDIETNGATAASKCSSLNLNGFNDWFQPNFEQSMLAYWAFKPTQTANDNSIISGGYVPSGLIPDRTMVPEFQQPGPHVFKSGNFGTTNGGYWLAGELPTRAAPANTMAVQGFQSGQIEYLLTNTPLRVRAMRRFPLPDGVFPPRIEAFSQQGNLTYIESSDFIGKGALAGHSSTDWEIWGGHGGNATTLLYQSVNDSVNKKVLNVENVLTPGIRYLPRVRYKATSGAVSPWSPWAWLMAAPNVPGTPFMGGYYAGKYVLNGNLVALIVAPKSGGQVTFNTTNTVTLLSGDTWSQIHGGTLMNMSHNMNRPESVWARGLTIGGFNDWYVPSWKEFLIMYYYLKPSSTTNTVDITMRNITQADPTINFTSGNPTRTLVPAFREDGSESIHNSISSMFLTSSWLQDGGTAPRMSRLVGVSSNNGSYDNSMSGQCPVRAVRIHPISA